MKAASSPFTHTTLYISWGCGSPGGTGVPGTEVAAGTCEKRIRPRALVCRDSKPRVSVPKLVYLVPCCTENLFFPSLAPSSFLLSLLPLLYHVFLLILYLPIFLVLLILPMLVPFIISLLFLTSAYFYSGLSLFSFFPPYPPRTFSTQSYLPPLSFSTCYPTAISGYDLDNNGSIPCRSTEFPLRLFTDRHGRMPLFHTSGYRGLSPHE